MEEVTLTNFLSSVQPRPHPTARAGESCDYLIDICLHVVGSENDNSPQEHFTSFFSNSKLHNVLILTALEFHVRHR